MSRVLIAEDERASRLIVKQLLEKEGHEVVEAADGQKAYDLAISDPPDIGILDVRMPGMDGFEVLKRLKQHPDTEHMPIVMLTSVPVEKGEPTADRFGASHYLSKPFDPKMLRMAVRSALRESESAPTASATDDGGVVMVGDVEFPAELAAPAKITVTAPPGGAIGIGEPMLDEKLGGGIPAGSLSLIEGHSSAGKSVLCQHLAYTSLSKGQSVVYITFEETTQGLLSKMASLGMDVSQYFEMNKLRVIPLEESSTYQDPERVLSLFIEVMEALPARYTTIIFDAITNVASYCDDRSVMGFFASCKKICKSGKTILLVAHSSVFDEKVMVRVASLCDVHLKLNVEKMGTKLVSSMEVFKVHKALMDTGNIVSFEVHPGIGMRINPISRFSV